MANAWTCETGDYTPPTEDITTSENTTNISKKVKGHTQESLSIMSWNCNHLTSKIPELKERLYKEDVDICLVQETMLSGEVRTPQIQGYTAIRSDRKVKISGGGLITYIKSSLPHEKKTEGFKLATEICSLRVKCGYKKWLDISNIYCPPPYSLGQIIKFSPEIIPTSNLSIITGDFNAHTHLWDAKQPPDDRGETIIDWIIATDMSVLNDANVPTRLNKDTGGLSSPDTAFAGKDISHLCEWKRGEPIGKSDHWPTTVTVHLKVQHQHVLGREPKWKRKDVNWPAWTQAVEDLCISVPQVDDPCKRLSRLAHFLDTAANQHIGKVKPGKNTKYWLTPPVREAIEERNKVRQTVGNPVTIEARSSVQANWSKSSEEDKFTTRKAVKKQLGE